MLTTASLVSSVIVACCFNVCSSTFNNETLNCPYSTDQKEICPNLRSETSQELRLFEKFNGHLRHIRTFQRILQKDYDEMANISAEISSKIEYLKYPMNIFSLLKRASHDWSPLTRIIINLPGNFNTNRIGARGKKRWFNVVSRFEEEKYLADLFNYTKGLVILFRLQTVYLMPADTLANVKMEGALPHTRMTVDDCFDMAVTSLDRGKSTSELNIFIDWMELIKQRLEEGERSRRPNRELFEYYVVSRCYAGDPLAADAFEKLVSDYRSFDTSRQLQEEIDLIMKHGCNNMAAYLKEERKKYLVMEKKEYYQEVDENNSGYFDPEEDRIRRIIPNDVGCRNVIVNTTRDKDLKCRYIHHHKPQLMIGPFKMEELHINPPVMKFHQVISDQEIKEFMDYGADRLETAPVRSFYTGEIEYIWEIRKCDIDWIDDNVLPLAERLSRRTALFSGLSLLRAEGHQLGRYGVGGEIVNHMDAVFDFMFDTIPYYADFAISMFYLNNVEKGGYTYFSRLNVTVVPDKGSAVVWFNRRADHQMDYSVAHIGCPVLQGSKWAINKWFYKNQEVPKCTVESANNFKYYYL